MPLVGSAIDIAVGQKWQSGCRMAGMISSNIIAERDGQFRKVAFPNVRPTEASAILPDTESLGKVEESSGSGLIRYTTSMPWDTALSYQKKGGEI